jgi:uncharacterized membrane protein
MMMIMMIIIIIIIFYYSANSTAKQPVTDAAQFKNTNNAER